MNHTRTAKEQPAASSPFLFVAPPPHRSLLCYFKTLQAAIIVLTEGINEGHLAPSPRRSNVATGRVGVDSAVRLAMMGARMSWGIRLSGVESSL